MRYISRRVYLSGNLISVIYLYIHVNDPQDLYVPPEWNICDLYKIYICSSRPRWGLYDLHYYLHMFIWGVAWPVGSVRCAGSVIFGRCVT